MSARPPFPPFTAETAAQKARAAEDGWNSRDPGRVALAYTEDSRWRNRAEFFSGREAIAEFLHRKWARELDYRLIKEVWAYAGNRIAVRFVYEWRDDSGSWFRSHGNENWEFDARGLMLARACQHQRRADPRGRPAVPLAGPGATPGRPSGADRARAVAHAPRPRSRPGAARAWPARTCAAWARPSRP